MRLARKVEKIEWMDMKILTSNKLCAKNHFHLLDE
jgi:hypothetical protein